MIGSISGSGPDLALIHGWGLGSAAWEPLLAALAQRCRVHLIDLPGYRVPEGRMNKQSSHEHCQQAHEQRPLDDPNGRTPFGVPYSPPSFIQTSAALIDCLPEGCILCGWSLGGMLALQAALLAPQRFKGLILIGSTPSFMQRIDWPHAQPPALLDTFSDAVSGDAGAALQRFIAVLNQGDTQARLHGRAMLKQLLTSELPATASLLSGLDWLRDVDLRDQIPSITTPTLLIHGERDPLMPLAAAQWLNDRLPQAQLATFAGAAHAPFLADPQRFVTLASDFCHANAAV